MSEQGGTGRVCRIRGRLQPIPGDTHGSGVSGTGRPPGRKENDLPSPDCQSKCASQNDDGLLTNWLRRCWSIYHTYSDLYRTPGRSQSDCLVWGPLWWAGGTVFCVGRGRGRIR